MCLSGAYTETSLSAGAFDEASAFATVQPLRQNTASLAPPGEIRAAAGPIANGTITLLEEPCRAHGPAWWLILKQPWHTYCA